MPLTTTVAKFLDTSVCGALDALTPASVHSLWSSPKFLNRFCLTTTAWIEIAYHSYADDTQIYLALSPNDYSPIDSLCQCIDEINSRMCQNFLQLNKEKTEVIAFGNKDEVLKVNAYLDSRGQTTKKKKLKN